ncbi:MAG: hypothetical protein HFE57_08405 [Firmicutes bacterium]|jgi:hypothetical protein|nr:hypothetical protein [Bacillota bacterium]
MDRIMKFFFKAKDIMDNWLIGTIAYLPKSKDSENYGYYISANGSEPYAVKIRKDTICRPLLIVDSKGQNDLFENDIVKIAYNEQDFGIGILTIKNGLLYFQTYENGNIENRQLLSLHFLDNTLINSEYLGNKFDADAVNILYGENSNVSSKNNIIR